MPDDNECKVSAFDSDALYYILTNVCKKDKTQFDFPEIQKFCSNLVPTV